jgi:hypothetical protein
MSERHHATLPPLSLSDIEMIGWRTLSVEETWRKDVVLAMLSDHSRPHNNHSAQYHEKSWNRANETDALARPVPTELLLDRDVLLARLARPDFHEHYTSNGREWGWFSLPVFRLREPFLGDKEIVVAVVHQYPEILKLQSESISEHLLDDVDVFQAYLGSMRWTQNPRRHGNAQDKLWNALPSLVFLFSPRIRRKQRTRAAS